MGIDDALWQSWLVGVAGLLLSLEEPLQHVVAAIGEQALQRVYFVGRWVGWRVWRLLLRILRHLRLGGLVIRARLAVHRLLRLLAKIAAARQIGLQEREQAGGLRRLW